MFGGAMAGVLSLIAAILIFVMCVVLGNMCQDALYKVYDWIDEVRHYLQKARRK